MVGLWRLTRSEIRLFFREKSRVFFTLLFLFLMIVLFGSMFKGGSINRVRYIDTYVPSWIGVTLLMTALFGLGAVLASYRELGILRRYQVTSIQRWNYSMIWEYKTHLCVLFGMFVVFLIFSTRYFCWTSE